jgi:hypothetical protein
MDEISDNKIKRMRNLKMFRDKTDDEIRDYLESKPDKPAKIVQTGDKSYDNRFNTKFDSLKNEYGLDMNDSNDIDALRQLVQHQLQLENINAQILDLQKREVMDMEDSRLLKNLGDYQRTLVTSITELQDRLGITRKVRKEKQIDDIPQYIKALQKKSKEFWEGKTLKVSCEKCSIEYVRIWVNFPNLTKLKNIEVECWKCGEIILFSQEVIHAGNNVGRGGVGVSPNPR